MFFDIYNAFTPIGHINALASALIAFGLLPGALTLVFLALQRHAAEVARELARYHPPREGHRLLEATVEEDGDSPVTLRVDVVRPQHADHLAQGERSSRGRARPFRVRDERGAVVRVEPGDVPNIEHDAVTTIGEPWGSTRVFDLEAGARVYVYGRVAGGEATSPGAADYRTASAPCVLAAPDDGPLEIHKTSPLSRLRGERLRTRGWQLLCPLALVAIEAVMFPCYVAQIVAGRVVNTTVRSLTTSYEGEHSSVSVCVASRGSDGPVCSEASLGDSRRFSVGASAHAIVVDPWPYANEVGVYPSVSGVAAFLALFAMVAFACSAFYGRRSVAPWRERRR